jgi:hypothetical protein
VLKVLLLLAVAVLVLAGVLAWQARTAYVHLDAASARIPQLREQITAGDVAAARATARAFAEDTGAARESVHGPHWSMVAALPGVGPNVEAVQVVTATVDDLATRALPDLAEAADVLDRGKLAPVKGRVDLAALQKAAAKVRSAAEEVATAERRLAAIDTDELHPRLRGPVEELAATVTEMHRFTDSWASRLSSVI